MQNQMKILLASLVAIIPLTVLADDIRQGIPNQRSVIAQNTEKSTFPQRKSCEIMEGHYRI